MSQDEDQNEGMNEGREVQEEGRNAPKVNWDEDFKPREKSKTKTNRPDFLQLNKPGEYRIRLIGATYRFNRYWDPFDSKTRIIVDEEDLFKTDAYKAGFIPRQTCTAHVIDRATGKIMLLERSVSFFKNFANFKEINKISPADPVKAPDFVISVTWKNGDKRQAEYKVTAVMASCPITPEEKALYDIVKCDLSEYYKSTPISKINDAFNALPEEKKIKPPKKDKNSAFGGAGGNAGGVGGAPHSANRSSSSSGRSAEPIREADAHSGNDAFDNDQNFEDSKF